jgi:hypothetical protein
MYICIYCLELCTPVPISGCAVMDIHIAPVAMLAQYPRVENIAQ